MTDAASLMQLYSQFNAMQNPTVNGVQPAQAVATGQMLQPNGTMGTAGAVPAGTMGGAGGGGVIGAGTAAGMSGIVSGIATALSGMAKAKAIPDPVQNVPAPPPTQPLANFAMPDIQPKPLTRPPGA